MKQKILILLPLLMIVFLLIFYNHYTVAKLDRAQSQPSLAATSFTMALVRNDKRLLMEIVDPTKRDEISIWLDSHQAFYCPPGFDFPSPMNFPPTSNDWKHTRIITQSVRAWGDFDNGTTIRVHTFYQCAIDINSDYGLNFELFDLIIEKKGDRWFVNSWGRICESKRLNGCM